MKCHLLLVVIIAGALAAPIDESKSAVILRYDSSIVGVDGYYFDFKTSDGISHSQEGRLKFVDSEDETVAISVHGSYSYQHDGITYTVDYVADENGFRIEGPIPICRKSPEIE